VANGRCYFNHLSSSVRIKVYVQPRASQTVVAGEHDGAIKIRLAAPPVDGAANAALVEFIAERLDIAKSCVRVAAGHTSRRKVIEIDGVTRDAIMAALI
jgi:uncharacterized protein